MVEVASQRESRKVKSLQMFRRPVQRARQGDRVGLCVTQLDAKVLERGLVSAAGYLPTVAGGVIRVRRIPYFKGEVATKAKFHVSLGHETVLAKSGNSCESWGKSVKNLFFHRLTLFAPEEGSPPAEEFSVEGSYQFVEKLSDLDEEGKSASDRPVFALMEFEHPVTIVPDCKGGRKRLSNVQ